MESLLLSAQILNADPQSGRGQHKSTPFTDEPWFKYGQAGLELSLFVSGSGRQAGGIRCLVEILNSSNTQITLLEKTVKVIRNLANDSPATRKSLRQTGAIEPLVRLMSRGEDNPVTVDAIAAIGYLTHNDSPTKAAVRRMGTIPLLVRMLHAGEGLLYSAGICIKQLLVELLEFMQAIPFSASQVFPAAKIAVEPA